MGEEEREPKPIPFAEMRAMIGSPPRVSAWIDVTQHRIDGFAGDTGDDAFIHVDPERAKASRFGGTIAHGLLTLSLLPLLSRTAMPKISDARMSVNYGFDQVRFLAPVPAGSRVRGRFALVSAEEEKPGFARAVYDVQVEIEGGERPALVTRWLLGHWLARPEAMPHGSDRSG